MTQITFQKALKQSNRSILSLSESTSVCDLAAMGEKELIETLRFQVK